MGNENTSEVSYDEFMSQFEEVRIENSQQMGEVRVCRKKTDHQIMVMLKEKWFNSSEALDKFKAKLKKRKKLSNDYNASIVTTLFKKSNEWCSQTFRCILVYEYHHRTLEKLMRHRKAYQANQIKFQENYFWSIAKDLVLGLKNFRDNDLYHGDVQPGNIFVLDNKRLKMIDSCFLNDSSSGLQRRQRDYEYFTPLSPQAISGLLYGMSKGVNYDKEKNDIWGLGVTILSLLINEDFSVYYDWDKCQIKFPLIKKRIQQLNYMNYSRILISFVSSMLENDEQLRPKIDKLFEVVIKQDDNSMPDNNEISIFEPELESLSNSNFAGEELQDNHVPLSRIRTNKDEPKIQKMEQPNNFINRSNRVPTQNPFQRKTSQPTAQTMNLMSLNNRQSYNPHALPSTLNQQTYQNREQASYLYQQQQYYQQQQNQNVQRGFNRYNFNKR